MPNTWKTCVIGMIIYFLLLIAAIYVLYRYICPAVVLVYLLLVVNFQSWVDPFIIITALPGAVAGLS